MKELHPELIATYAGGCVVGAVWCVCGVLGWGGGGWPYACLPLPSYSVLTPSSPSPSPSPPHPYAHMQAVNRAAPGTLLLLLLHE